MPDNRLMYRCEIGCISFFIFSILFFFSNSLFANEVNVTGIVILESGNQDRPITVFIDAASNMAFMDPSSEKEETFLFDLKQSAIYSIDHEKEVVMEMDMLPKYVPDERMKSLSLKKTAGAVKIDKYSAEKYVLNADNAECMSVYISDGLTKLDGVGDFFSLYGRVIKLGNVGNVFKSLKDKSASRYCVYAKEYIYKGVQIKGIPVKLEKEGKSLVEVISIGEGMVGDKRMFLLPEGYRKTSMRAEIIKAVKNRQGQPPK